LNETREYIWLDGTVVPAEDAKISVKTHALNYGTAVFEGVRGYFRNDELYIFRLKEHSERLINSSRMIHLDLKLTAEEISRGIIEMLRKNGLRKNVYIRPIAFVGEGGINLDFRKHPKHIAAFAIPFESYFERSGLRVCTSSWRRVSLSSMMPRAKAAGNYLNSSIATVEAKLAGYDEALLLDEEGRVSEGAGENVFMFSGETLVTPPVYAAILEGITRQTVITIAGEAGIRVEERPIDRSELYTAKEVFFTGTATELEAVLEIDGRKVADGTPGEVTKQLKAAYSEIVSGRSKKHASWLTPVYGSGRVAK
jgi:branched-chain amino acid aminotransferase